jgi:hypothetical protein
MTDAVEQFGRKAALIVSGSNGDGLDLSELRFTFTIRQSDEESPNTAVIRVYNLADETVRKISGEFTHVTIQAGYESSYGVIFNGTIKQFYKGRENARDSFLEIRAGTGDIEYNFGLTQQTLASNSTAAREVADAIAANMGLKIGYFPSDAELGYLAGIKPRGKVLFGHGRIAMRNLAASLGSTWHIDNDGKVNVIPLRGYMPGEVVELNSFTGMVGVPEQTDQGVRVRCLLNPKLKIGRLVKINNGEINQLLQADLRADGSFVDRNLPQGQLPFDRRAGLQMPADVAADGYYRLYVVEFSGDTRGQDWYSEIICLAVDKSSNTVLFNG